MPSSYSPIAAAILQATQATQGAKPSAGFEQFMGKAVDPIYSILEGMGVPKTFPISQGLKFSPKSLLIQQLSGIQPKDFKMNDLEGLSLAGDALGAGIVGGTANALKYANSARKIAGMESFANTQIPKDVLAAGSWKGAEENITDRILQMREMAGEVTHPALVQKASDTVHSTINRIQESLTREYVARREAANKTKGILDFAQRLSDKVKQGMKELPDSIPNTLKALENAQ